MYFISNIVINAWLYISYMCYTELPSCK